ncbi:MAG: DNA polymerase III subunit gamma/tau [Erysipelotrichaceae bacterium]|nr:DNA polymerase III subunit gamma/tau [Erysipelotrichaceae bacterium]
MEYQALYRKYRPTKFSDVVDQENILKIITNSLKENKVSHAYLFSGPRGTGKTTIAKLLAKTVNCLNLKDDFSICHECENCLDIENNSSDIIEIDAASNNGVDEIRELKSKINLVPSKLKYKVYIIDEVHMLSTSAFNALLKTLEEPPSHVIFILATTEFYKVPATIVSRCQCLTFKRISKEGLIKRIKEVANLENIKITDEAVEEIAIYSEGGMRDALGMLDKLASYSLKEITLDDFLSINGLISNNDLNTFIDKIISKDNEQVLEQINAYEDLGIDYAKIVEKVLERLRDLLVEHYVKKNDKYDPKVLYDLVFVFNDIYNYLKDSINKKIIVEVKLLDYMNKIDKPNNSEPFISREIIKNQKSVVKEQKSVGNTDIPPKNDTNNETYTIDEEVKKQRIINTFAIASKALKNNLLTKWSLLTDYITNPKYSAVASCLKDVEIGVVSAKNILLVSKYNNITDKIYSNYDLVLELLKEITDNTYKIVVIDEPSFKEEVLNFKNHMNDQSYYTYQEETKDMIIKNQVYKDNNLCYGNLVQKAIDVFGSEYVSVSEKGND